MSLKILSTALLILPLAAPAAELFTVTTTGAAALRVNGSNLLDLQKDSVEARGAFSAIANNSVRIAVNYAGVPDAIVLDIVVPTAPGGLFIATLRMPGFTRTFAGTTKAELQTSIEDFVKNASPERRNFVEAAKRIFAQTPVTVTDGTPHSSTALMANRAFDEFGLRHGKTNDERGDLDAGKELDTGHFGVFTDAGRFETEGGFKGEAYTVAPTLRLGERWGFVISAPIRYLNIEGAESGELGLLAGIPLQIISEAKDSHLFWQISPHAHAALAGSLDMGQAGLGVGGGVTNRIGYNFGFCTVQMANQFGHFEGVEIDNVDTGVLQQIVKNGLQVSVPVADDWLIEGRAVRTDFLNDAAVPEYYTFGVDLVLRTPARVSLLCGLLPDDLHAGVYVDMDFKDYVAPHARAGARWKW